MSLRLATHWCRRPRRSGERSYSSRERARRPTHADGDGHGPPWRPTERDESTSPEAPPPAIELYGKDEIARVSSTHLAVERPSCNLEIASRGCRGLGTHHCRRLPPPRQECAWPWPRRPFSPRLPPSSKNELRRLWSGEEPKRDERRPGARRNVHVPGSRAVQPRHELGSRVSECDATTRKRHTDLACMQVTCED